MNRSLLTVALTLCASMAVAQTPPTDAAPAPAPESQELTAPPLPTPPAELAREIAALQAIARLTTDCFTQRGERVSHIADRRCPQWYARLTRGGAATVYAVGSALTPDTFRGDVGMGDDPYTPAARLGQIMVATGAPEAAPYLLSFLARSVADEELAPGAEPAVIEALIALTGHDLVPRGPWDGRWGDSLDARRATAQAWLRWYRDHAGETPAQWRAAGEARAREALSSDDPAVRMSAVQRLIGVRGMRPAITAALAGLRDRPGVPDRVWNYVNRYARRHRLTLPAPAATASP